MSAVAVNDFSSLSARHLLSAIDEFLEFGFVFHPRTGEFLGRYRVPPRQLWSLFEYGVALYEELLQRQEFVSRDLLDAVLDPLLNLLATATIDCDD